MQQKLQHEQGNRFGASHEFALTLGAMLPLQMEFTLVQSLPCKIIVCNDCIDPTALPGTPVNWFSDKSRCCS